MKKIGKVSILTTLAMLGSCSPIIGSDVFYIQNQFGEFEPRCTKKLAEHLASYSLRPLPSFDHIADDDATAVIDAMAEHIGDLRKDLKIIVDLASCR